MLSARRLAQGDPGLLAAMKAGLEELRDLASEHAAASQPIDKRAAR